MFQPLNFRLLGVHEASQYHSWVTLEDYPFVRDAPSVAGIQTARAHVDLTVQAAWRNDVTSALAGLTAKQCEDQKGLFDEGTCRFMEYLSEVCIRVAVDKDSYNAHNYDIDYTHADAGCYPEDGLQVPQYSRLPAIEGQKAWYLPKSAMEGPRMVVRHAHDPELMEKVLKFELKSML